MTVHPTWHRRVLLCALALVCWGGLAAPATGAAEPVPAPARAAAPSAGAAAAAVTFSDDFDGPAGAAVDPGKWQIETGDNVNNHERQYYTAGNRNAALDGQGHLVITARRENPANYTCWYGRCEYTSARLNTAGRFTQTYGHVEARLKVPRGQGMWPAFWMLGNDIGQVGWPNSGEIDVMENVGFEPSTVHGTLHGPGYSGAAWASGRRTPSPAARPSPTPSTPSPSTGPPTPSPGPWTASSTSGGPRPTWAGAAGRSTSRSS